ncbi:hypothetical protein [Sphingomonas jatrophae]|uniref:Inner membrane protein n=1 Tax=Sphingomonas jatrophae TaxID=1166337 RepID=A0A1I6M8D0_9SPHN|nr:hypothetical protein [Sphingomonas jatrophae]SFS11980.1 hypothetical protein SAMN05192580_3663 [Sphingomonas jatrophae]
MTIDDEARPSRSRGLLPRLVALLLAFLAGTLAMGYALTHWDTAARYLRPAEPDPVPLPAMPAQPSRPPVIVTPLPLAAVEALSGRVVELEGRIGAIDARARVASVNADRAEALLVAFAARRALDRGVGLGYLEPLMRARFGEAQPQAVATILTAARLPVTLDELRAGLAQARPALAGAGPRAGWWQAVRREIAGLVVLRRATAPSMQPADRLDRAQAAVEAGHVDRALAEVARLPGRDAAAGWIASARRYVSARQALDLIEAAALNAPRPDVTPPASAPAADPVQPAAEESSEPSAPAA